MLKGEGVVGGDGAADGDSLSCAGAQDWETCTSGESSRMSPNQDTEHAVS